MAVTNQNSAQITAGLARGAVTNRAPDDAGFVEYLAFTFTQVGVGDPTSTMKLQTLPAGRVRVLNVVMGNSALGASRTISVGTGAYVDANNATVAANATAFFNAKDVSAALSGQTATGDLSGAVYDSGNGVDVIATLAGGTIPDGATLKGYITFGRG